MRTSLILALGLIATIGSGCAEKSFTAATVDMIQVQKGPVPTERPSCEVDTVDYELRTHVISFQMKDKGGLSFGFNLFSGFLQAIGLSLKTESGQMDVAMDIFEPVKAAQSVIDVTGHAEMKEREFRFTLDAARLKADLGYFYQTPLATLSERALQNTFRAAADRLSKIETDWNTRVITVPQRNQVVIPVGSVAGLQEGDQFQVFNVEHEWAGEPCLSHYILARKTTRDPIATGVVTQLDKNAAVISLDVASMDDDHYVKPGARVEILKLVDSNGKKRTTLARSIRLGRITSEKLVIKDLGEVDMRKFMDHQIKPVIGGFNYYVRP